MLVLPTSATTAIIFEQSQGSPAWVLFGYLTISLLFACGYCVWQMVLSLLGGQRPALSRWVLLGATVTLFAAGVAAEALLLAEVTFNGKLETYWGFALSPWFFVAFIPCALALILVRAWDAGRANPAGRGRAVVLWCLGCLLVSACGAVALWAGGRSSAVETGATALGWVLAIAAVATLLLAALKWRAGEGSRTDTPGS